MTVSSDREKGLEDKYILDFQRSLKVRERRDHLVAAWAARAIGRSDLGAYVEEVVAAGRAEPGDDDVLCKVLRDLNAANVPASEEMLREKMRALLFLAAEQLEAEG